MGVPIPCGAGNTMLKTAVLGVTGYVGQQLAAILCAHPNVSLRALTSEKFAGISTDNAFPHLGDRIGLTIVSVAKAESLGPFDLVFSCLPRGVSGIFVKKFLEKGAVVIDLSPDFRHSNPDDYARIYGATHRFPELLPEAAYGLSELNRERIKNAQLIANAGCYSTCVCLGMASFLSAFGADKDIIADVKSSVSTAGRAARADSHYSEASAEVSAENTGGHDQKHEILRVLSSLCPDKKNLVFSNTRVPVKRGIMAISYLKPSADVSLDEVVASCREFYEKDMFVRVHEEGVPGLSSVVGSNFVDLGFELRDGFLIVVSVLDNLMKGAAGQAVQNMNIVFGFPENEGLGMMPLFP